MKRLEYKEFFTRDEILDNVKDNDGTGCAFIIRVPWQETTVFYLHSEVMEKVQDGKEIFDSDGDIEYFFHSISDDKAMVDVLVEITDVDHYVSGNY